MTQKIMIDRLVSIDKKMNLNKIWKVTSSRNAAFHSELILKNFQLVFLILNTIVFQGLEQEIIYLFKGQ